MFLCAFSHCPPSSVLSVMHINTMKQNLIQTVSAREAMCVGDGGILYVSAAHFAAPVTSRCPFTLVFRLTSFYPVAQIAVDSCEDFFCNSAEGLNEQQQKKSRMPVEDIKSLQSVISTSYNKMPKEKLLTGFQSPHNLLIFHFFNDINSKCSELFCLRCVLPLSCFLSSKIISSLVEVAPLKNEDENQSKFMVQALVSIFISMYNNQRPDT